MARQKKTATAVVLKAKSRLQGLKDIDPKLDLGGGMTVAAFEKEVSAMLQKIESYNSMLNAADKVSNELEEMEKQLAYSSSRMLAGVVTRFGRNSSEYEMAGGVRTSDRKRKKARPTLETTTV
ncbi:MAG: hypothetical protein WA883_16035 [Phormidesmis sp.]